MGGVFNSGSSIRDFGPGVKKAADFYFYLLSGVFKSARGTLAVAAGDCFY